MVSVQQLKPQLLQHNMCTANACNSKCAHSSQQQVNVSEPFTKLHTHQTVANGTNNICTKHMQAHASTVYESSTLAQGQGLVWGLCPCASCNWLLHYAPTSAQNGLDLLQLAPVVFFLPSISSFRKSTLLAGAVVAIWTTRGTLPREKSAQSQCPI